MTSGPEAGALLRAAAHNNAGLCDAVTRSHGLAPTWADDAWTCARRTPPYYPDAVTLGHDVDPVRLLERIDGAPGASVKDSFSALDLSVHGFRILFDAEWIALLHPTPSPSHITWTPVTDATALSEWEDAWRDGESPRGLFRAELLQRPDVVILRGELDGVFVAGAVLIRSETVVGVSNLFTATGDLDAVWAACVADVSARFPGAAIVGYESGDQLDAARRSGFRSIGPLRIWIND